MAILKILLIDDNPSDRVLALRELQRLFSNLEYQEITNLSQFEAALSENNFNLVITDYQLCWTTGIEILHKIRGKKPECPVIMFTGTGSEEIAVEAMKSGLDDYVIKSPQHYVRLAAAVRSAWMRSRQQKALEEFQQRYYRTFERVPIGLYRSSSTGEILEANSTLVELLGYPSRQELMTKNIADYYIDQSTRQLWNKKLSKSGIVQDFEVQLQRFDNKLLWVDHNVTAVKDKQGNVIYYEGSIQDISEAKQREAERKQAESERLILLQSEQAAKESAEVANRIKDEFLATLSHELRTPLNAILGWVQLLRNGQLSLEQSSKALEVIERNAKAQNQLINDLLDVSRIIRGKMEVKFQPINLTEVILVALDTIRPAAQAKSIQITTNFQAINQTINGDFERLQQVCWNLLVNAIKFTPNEGKIAISLIQRSQLVVIEVNDTGQGIAPEILPYIFDRFRQAETKSSTRTQGGLGLGLAIVRHLIEMHGGIVTVSSAGLGEGATFTVELPLLVYSDRKAFLSTTNTQPTPLLNLENLQILLVEDEADAREMVALILEECGAKIFGCTSVQQAKIKLDQQNFDLLISDISMPGEDGYDLISYIRNLNSAIKNLKAIALTAYARKEDETEALAAGFNLHLAKPIEPVALVTAITRLVGRK